MPITPRTQMPTNKEKSKPFRSNYYIPSMLLGSESSVLVLQRSPSPVPSIQTYMTWTLSPWGSSMYCCLTALLSSALADIAILFVIKHLRNDDEKTTGTMRLHQSSRLLDQHWFVWINMMLHNSAFGDRVVYCSKTNQSTHAKIAIFFSVNPCQS